MSNCIILIVNKALFVLGNLNKHICITVEAYYTSLAPNSRQEKVYVDDYFKRRTCRRKCMSKQLINESSRYQT